MSVRALDKGLRLSMRRRHTEGAGVHEAPEPGVLRAEDRVAWARNDPLKDQTENVRDNLKEETRDLNRLRAEVLSGSRKRVRRS